MAADDDATATEAPWIAHPWVSAGQGALRFGIGVAELAPRTD